MRWFLVVLFLTMTIMFLLGKGSFLIAGYNTSSKNEKAKYNVKKLCRVMGGGMGVITIVLIVLAYFGDNPPDWLPTVLFIVIAIVTITILVLCNTICKVKNPATADVTEENGSKKKGNERILKVSLLFTAVVFLAVGIMLSTGQIEITVEGDSIVIDGSYWKDYTVQLDNIESVSYVDTFEVGKRTNGLGSFKLLEGHFRNTEFGDYILYAYKKCDRYIVLDTSDGFVVLNAETSRETEAFYKVLESAAAQNQ